MSGKKETFLIEIEETDGSNHRKDTNNTSNVDIRNN